MVFINIFFVFMFITALLEKIVSAPPKRREPYRSSTSSVPFALNEPKYPPDYYKFLEGNYYLQHKNKTKIF